MSNNNDPTTTTTRPTPTTAPTTSPPPSTPKTIFDAVANNNLEGVIEEYVKNAQSSISSYLNMRKRWASPSAAREEIKAEEKLDEYLQQLVDDGTPWSSTTTTATSRQEGNDNKASTTTASLQQNYLDGKNSKSIMGEGDNTDFYIALQQLNRAITTHNVLKGREPLIISDECDRIVWQSLSALSNSRPATNFLVRSRQHDNTSAAAATPLFDGIVANATPPPLGPPGVRPSGGSGTLLHLACAMDSPFSLAVALALGADVRSPHTAFRRLMIHEASCFGSDNSLRLLLELGKECALQLYKEDQLYAQSPSSSFSSSDEDNMPTLSMSFENTEEDAKPKPKPAVPETRNWVEKLRDFHKLAQQVRKGTMKELDAARIVLAYDTIPTSSRQILAQSCSFLVRDCTVEGNPFHSAWYADGHGNTPLHWAAFKNEHECVRLLLAYHANPNTRAHPSGWTALHDAAYSNAAESIELLLDAGANVDARANSGATPICFAAQEDADGAARLLLERGADLSSRCAGVLHRPDHPSGRFSGYTPLHYCSHYNAYKAARVLLQSPDAIHAMEMPDLSDRLPIHVAVARGSADVLRELLHAGARIETPYGSPPSPRRSRIRPTSPSHSETSSVARAIPSSPSAEDAGTPVSSPVLRSMIPSRPITSNKPWNCLTQRSIDECRQLISEAEQSWNPERHPLFTPADRRAVVELLRVGKRLEQMGTGIFIDLWPLVLSFCGRAWFEVDDRDSSGDEEEDYDDDIKMPAFDVEMKDA